MTQNPKLLDPDRIQKILTHRRSVFNFDPKVASAVGLLRVRNSLFNESNFPTDFLEQKVDTVNWPEITLKEMSPGVKYTGHVIHVISIDRARSYQFERITEELNTPLSVQALFQDKNCDVMRAFIYNYSYPQYKPDDIEEEKYRDFNEEIVQSMSGACERKSIANPQLKMAADGQLTLVVDKRPEISYTRHPSGSKTYFNEELCRFCLKEGPKLRCSRCKKAYYCGKECQSEDWTKLKHKLVCFGRTKADLGGLSYMERPPWTVYELEKCCLMNEFPKPNQVQLLVDYGFANCQNNKQMSNLLGLYQGMIKIMMVDMVKLHLACISGTLEGFIKFGFETYGNKPRLPRRGRENWTKGEFYTWFLENPSIVKNRFTKSS